MDCVCGCILYSIPCLVRVVMCMLRLQVNVCMLVLLFVYCLSLFWGTARLVPRMDVCCACRMGWFIFFHASFCDRIRNSNKATSSKSVTGAAGGGEVPPAASSAAAAAAVSASASVSGSGGGGGEGGAVGSRPSGLMLRLSTSKTPHACGNIGANVGTGSTVSAQQALQNAMDSSQSQPHSQGSEFSMFSNSSSSGGGVGGGSRSFSLFESATQSTAPPPPLPQPLPLPLSVQHNLPVSGIDTSGRGSSDNHHNHHHSNTNTSNVYSDEPPPPLSGTVVGAGTGGGPDDFRSGRSMSFGVSGSEDEDGQPVNGSQHSGNMHIL
jgi:hypothetical protein